MEGGLLELLFLLLFIALSYISGVLVLCLCNIGDESCYVFELILFFVVLKFTDLLMSCYEIFFRCVVSNDLICF